jgi:hypothetical protein
VRWRWRWDGGGVAVEVEVEVEERTIAYSDVDNLIIQAA